MIDDVPLSKILPLHVVRRQRFGAEIVLERKQPGLEVMIDLQPIVAEQIVLVVEIRQRVRPGAGNGLRRERREVAELQHRRRCSVDFLGAQRNLRVEPIVALMRRERRAGKALDPATVLPSSIGRLRVRYVHRVVAAAAVEVGRPVVGEQRRLVFVHHRAAVIQLQIPVPVVSADLIA